MESGSGSTVLGIGSTVSRAQCARRETLIVKNEFRDGKPGWWETFLQCRDHIL